MVIGVELDGIAKAYPVSLLNRREMVNDQLAQLPILVTWWPLCATAMVHRREIDGRDILFGNHGALLGSAMTWWDPPLPEGPPARNRLFCARIERAGVFTVRVLLGACDDGRPATQVPDKKGTTSH